jgi:hypothetical protein
MLKSLSRTILGQAFLMAHFEVLSAEDLADYPVIIVNENEGGLGKWRYPYQKKAT